MKKKSVPGGIVGIIGGGLLLIGGIVAFALLMSIVDDPLFLVAFLLYIVGGALVITGITIGLVKNNAVGRMLLICGIGFAVLGLIFTLCSTLTVSFVMLYLVYFAGGFISIAGGIVGLVKNNVMGGVSLIVGVAYAFGAALLTEFTQAVYGISYTAFISLFLLLIGMILCFVLKKPVTPKAGYAQQPPYGQNPYAQQPPYGQNPYGQNPYAQQPPQYGQNPYGQNPYAQQNAPGMNGQFKNNGDKTDGNAD